MDPPENPAPPAAYVNFLRVSSHANEFFLAFGQLTAQGQTASLLASLVTAPAHAKSMRRALAQAVARHEEQFGEIPEASTSATPEAPAPKPTAR